jgi:PBP1b-binding outer membrane lipoprotein LpoB
MKCNFCDTVFSDAEFKEVDDDFLTSVEVLISKDLKTHVFEKVTVDLCDNCIKRIKGEE